LAFQLVDEQGKARFFVSSVTVDRWLPGSIEPFTEEFLRQPSDLPAGKVEQVTDQIRLPADLPPGEYRISLGVVDTTTPQPVVQLGIQGRSDNGWYPLSKITLTR
jgi:hypothetical protein